MPEPSALESVLQWMASGVPGADGLPVPCHVQLVPRRVTGFAAPYRTEENCVQATPTEISHVTPVHVQAMTSSSSFSCPPPCHPPGPLLYLPPSSIHATQSCDFLTTVIVISDIIIEFIIFIISIVTLIKMARQILKCCWDVVAHW